MRALSPTLLPQAVAPPDEQTAIASRALAAVPPEMLARAAHLVSMALGCQAQPRPDGRRASDAPGTSGGGDASRVIVGLAPSTRSDAAFVARRTGPDHDSPE